MALRLAKESKGSRRERVRLLRDRERPNVHAHHLKFRCTFAGIEAVSVNVGVSARPPGWPNC